MQFTVELPTQNGQQSSGNKPVNDRPAVDWAAKDNYVAEVLGIGKHVLIGRVSLLTDLGIQARPEQSIEWDDKAKSEHSWRLENDEEGKPKCAGARLGKKFIKGKEVEVLIYPQTDVAQVAISVDFPEKMLELSRYFNPTATEHKPLPFRDIIGLKGWGGFKFDVEGKRKDVVASPFNMNHTNVNRNRKDAKPHYAFAKTSKLYDLASYCKVLDEEDNFHMKDMGKLLGKACMFEVEVSWNEYNDKHGVKQRKLETRISPSAVMSPRDEKYYVEELLPLMDADAAGMLMFKGGNRERDLQVCNQTLINTMSFAKNWSTSELKKELEALKGIELPDNAPSDEDGVKPSGDITQNVAANASKSNPVESSPVDNTTVAYSVNNTSEPVLDTDWDDDNI